MLHIYMLRCSAIGTAWEQLYELLKETIVKLHCQKQAQGLFFEKIVLRIQLQVYRGNAQQVAFTPTKFAKQ